MNVADLTTFISPETAVGLLIIFVIQCLGKLLYKYINPRFGRKGVQATVFGLSLVAVVLYTYVYTIPTVMESVTVAFKLCVASIGLYELTWANLKKVPASTDISTSLISSFAK